MRGNACIPLTSEIRCEKGTGEHVTTNKNDNSVSLKHLAEAERELKEHTTIQQLYFDTNLTILQKKDDQNSKRSISN